MHDPAHIDGYVRLAWLLRSQLDDAEGADRIMDARAVKDGLIAANTQSSRAHLERAFYRKKYHLSGVDEDLARASSSIPTSRSCSWPAASGRSRRGSSMRPDDT